MEFAFECVRTIRSEEPELFDEAMQQQVYDMLEEAIACELAFAEDVLSGGVAGISMRDMRQYLQHCADQHFIKLGLPQRYQVRNPLPFMELQDVQELTNFFERRVSAYQVGVSGDVAFDHAF
jgi:ribonucleoside-diphosphate reductase beta chain